MSVTLSLNSLAGLIVPCANSNTLNTKDGSVVTWGEPTAGGDRSLVLSSFLIVLFQQGHLHSDERERERERDLEVVRGGLKTMSRQKAPSLTRSFEQRTPRGCNS